MFFKKNKKDQNHQEQTKRMKIVAVIVAMFYLGGILAAIEAVMTARTPTGAVAWSVSLVTFPMVSLPAYLFLGRNKFEGYTEAFESNTNEIEALSAEFKRDAQQWQLETTDQPSVIHAIEQLAGFELTHSNSAELLINGDATFDSILKGVAAAKDYVFFQFYMFHDDELGRQVKDSLIAKAKQGVRVYMLYDEIGSGGLPDAYINELRVAGVEVTSFKPTQGSRNRFQINFRNHRKMVVVDGIYGWVGGHNVGDEYMGRDPKFSPWRDTHVKLQGPVVTQLQAVMLQDWYWAKRELPKVNWESQAADNGNVNAMIVPFSPSKHLEIASLFFVSALNSAKHRIWISAPYFVPDEAVMKALQLAALRGVDVRVITTGTYDSLPVYLAAFYYIKELRDLGIRFYAYTPGFLHEKVMLVDDHISTVGTPNFDNRSFRLNFEVTSLILDEDFANQMQSMFEIDFAHAKELNPNEFDAKPFWWRLAVNVSRLASPVL